MSRNAAPKVSLATGYPITTVWNEWSGRDLSVNPLNDAEIIPYLGGKAGHRAVWINQDWNASSQHRDLLVSHRISVLWLRGPGGRQFSLLEQSPVLIAVLATAHRLVAGSSEPVYLTRYDPDGGLQPILERLAGTLQDSPLRWQRVPQNQYHQFLRRSCLRFWRGGRSGRGPLCGRLP